MANFQQKARWTFRDSQGRTAVTSFWLTVDTVAAARPASLKFCMVSRRAPAFNALVSTLVTRVRPAASTH